MEIKKLLTLSLTDALRAMQVGQTAIAPDDASEAYVRKTAAALRTQGYLFQTSTRTGVQTITRLK